MSDEITMTGETIMKNLQNSMRAFSRKIKIRKIYEYKYKRIYRKNI